MPTKDKKADYDRYLTLMTEKIKSDLAYEVRRKKLR
jgi:hypothetical protein